MRNVVMVFAFSVIIPVQAAEYQKFGAFVGAGMYYPGPTLNKPYDDPEFLVSGIGGSAQFHFRTTQKSKIVVALAYYGFDRSRIFGAGAHGKGIQPSIGIDYLVFQKNRNLSISSGAQISYVNETVDFEYPSPLFSSTTPPKGTDKFNLLGIGPTVEFTLFRCVNLRGSLPLLIPLSCKRNINYMREDSEGELDVHSGIAPRFSLSFGWSWQV